MHQAIISATKNTKLQKTARYYPPVLLHERDRVPSLLSPNQLPPRFYRTLLPSIMSSTWDQVENIFDQAADAKEQSFENSYDNDVNSAASSVENGVNDFAQ